MGSSRLHTLRLKNDFADLRESGRYLKASPWLLIQYKSNSNNTVRPGWTLSRKTAKAVTRNKVKRWAREYFRGISNPPSINLNLIFRSPEKGFFKNLKYDEFNRVLKTSLEKIEQRVGASRSSSH